MNYQTESEANQAARLETAAANLNHEWLAKLPQEAIEEIATSRPEQAFYVAAKWRQWLTERERPGKRKLFLE